MHILYITPSFPTSPPPPPPPPAHLISLLQNSSCVKCVLSSTPFYQVGSARDRSGGCTRASMHLRHTPHSKQIKFIIYTIYYIEKSAYTLIFTRPSAYPFDARTRRVTAPALLLRLPLGAPHTTHLTCPKQRAPRGRPGPRPSGGA